MMPWGGDKAYSPLEGSQTGAVNREPWRSALLRFLDGKGQILLYLAAIFCLSFGTEVFTSDSYVEFNRYRPAHFPESLGLPDLFAIMPGHYYTFVFIHFVFPIEEDFAFRAVQLLSVTASFVMASRFFRLYLSEAEACCVAFLFIFYVTHEITAYTFLNMHYPLITCMYLYAFVLAKRRRFGYALSLALIASFFVYGSLPGAVLVAFLCVLERRYFAAALLYLPNLLYILYYFQVRCLSDYDRLPERINALKMATNYLVQAASFLDVNAGPSFWLKLVLSYRHISVLSCLLGLGFAYLVHRRISEHSSKIDRKLLASLVAFAMAAYGIYAINGKYFQLVFTVNCVVNLFGSLLMAYLVVTLVRPAWLRSLFVAMLIVSMFGISDHWRGIRADRLRLMADIRANAELRELVARDELVYVSGMLYSSFGPMSHIEFNAQRWMMRNLISLLYGVKRANVSNITPYHHYADHQLKSDFYRSGRNDRGLGDGITVYEADTNRILRLRVEEINAYLATKPRDYRHWIQLIDWAPFAGIVRRLYPGLPKTVYPAKPGA